uniref:Copper binding protein n=3 Tax=Fulvimarina pelagi TaxID=217511 RepID=A0A0P0ZAX7_9HYPH|nr:copper binding protein [Fulvimarina pelagi]
MRMTTVLTALSLALPLASVAKAQEHHHTGTMEHGSIAHGDGHKATSEDVHRDMHGSMGHDHAPAEAGHDAELVVGVPGEAEQASRTIDVSMKEDDDGAMIFEPASIAVEEGETVRLTIRNDGELEHEFVLGDRSHIAEHKGLMERFPEMEHADPNAVRLQPGESGEIVWTFTKAGDFEFACLIPGHYDAGMHGKLTVASK